MLIELKALKVYPAMSEETTAYTADVYVDGVKTFAAKNDGHGGCDFYRPYPSAKVTEQQVNAWLAANAKPLDMSAYGMPNSPCDLELYVGRLIARAEAEKRLNRMLKAKIAFLRGGDIYTLKADPTPANLAKAAQILKAGDVLINNAGDDVRERALAALGATE